MKKFLQTTSSNSKNQKHIKKLPGGLTLTQFISLVTFVMGIITIYIHLEVRVAEINVDLANLKQDLRMHKSENQKDFETLHYDISFGNKEILRNVNEIQIYLRNKKLSYDRKTIVPKNPLIPNLEVGATHPEFDHSTKQTMKPHATQPSTPLLSGICNSALLPRIMKFVSRKSRKVLTYGTWHMTHGTCPCSGKRSFLSLFLLIRQKK
jgi:hypothetical protein